MINLLNKQFSFCFKLLSSWSIPKNFTGNIEFVDGDKHWYLNDEFHRTDGPAIEYADGSKEWFLNGKYHRKDGPACEYLDGDKAWCLNDEFHRTDGPAIKHSDGSERWYLNGKEYSEKQWQIEIKKFATVDQNLNSKIHICI